jgi:MoaA/NifB/PqqE/SkfB family radical SAM enzyme
MNAHVARLPILVLEPHSRCNCRCVMCDIWKRTDTQEISEAELARHLDGILRLGVEWVVFTGGEPLMHSGLFRLAQMLRAHSIRITLLSTGLLLEREAVHIVDSIDEVIVSLDGPAGIHDQIRRVAGAYDHLMRGVTALHRVAPNFLLSGRCTVQSANAGHLRSTVSAARALGLRSISFLAADLTSTAFNRIKGWPEARQSSIAPDLAALEQEMAALIADYPPDGFVLESPAKLRRIVSHFRAHHGLEAHVAPLCNAPWVSAVWEAGGDVRPCFFHPPIGNTADATLEEIVNGDEAVRFRERLSVEDDPICRRCVCSINRT